MRSRDVTLLFTLAVLAAACGGPADPSTVEVAAVVRDVLPDDPDDPAWRDAPYHDAELLLQDMVEPRLLERSTARVRVRAITDGASIALLLRWDDRTRDDLPGAGRFTDACAVQFPRAAGPDVPAPQMGEEGRVVEIAYWRASWQASVDGRTDTIQELYPGATVDHYPFEAASLEPGSPQQRELASQYAPADALNHRMEGPRAKPVEDLLAEGPGTLSPAPEQRSAGRGARHESGWGVVIVRPLPADLGPGRRTQVAFAVWDGALQEVGARKMRSAWVPIHIEEEPS